MNFIQFIKKIFNLSPRRKKMCNCRESSFVIKSIRPNSIEYWCEKCKQKVIKFK